jgi:hypothetical protein
VESRYFDYGHSRSLHGLQVANVKALIGNRVSNVGRCKIALTKYATRAKRGRINDKMHTAAGLPRTGQMMLFSSGTALS